MNQEKLESNTNNINTNNSGVTSPISAKKLVSKVNSLTGVNRSNSLTNPQTKSYATEKGKTLDYKLVLDDLNKLYPVNNLYEFYSKVYGIILQNIDSGFCAVGLYKEKSNCINLRLQDKLGNFYSTKVFLKDEDNPIIRVFTSQQPVFVEDVSFLKLAYFKNNPIVILPLLSVNKCIGVMIFADNYARQNVGLYTMIANCVALVSHNMELIETSDKYVNTDNLTLLYNHRCFQELLSDELSRAEISKQNLSVIMLDICNITKINRDMGHAKGDEVIKLVAENVRKNVREGDIAARYGGDELAIILPNTNVEQAKYVAEYLTYPASTSIM